jgi:lipopolysaccharide biosynthesis protein/SAM-dependent methyltransferase
VSSTALHLPTELESHGYRYDPQSGVWSRPDFQGIAYTDGDAVEEHLREIVQGSRDRSVLSPELQVHCTDWPTLYHLSSSRANLLRPFADSLRGARVLEIGAGCGAITRFLGESGAEVLAVEGSPRRAVIARLRTADLDSVTVVSDHFDKFDTGERFDFVTLIGVLEYAALFSGGEEPSRKLLMNARRFLAPGGRLIVAIENRYGLKYFAGAPEDHLGAVMAGIENRYSAGGVRTFGRVELTTLLESSGFGGTQFLVPLPDYKVPISILTESGLRATDFDGAALAAQSARRDPQLPGSLYLSLERTWPGLFENQLALDLANSFLVVASADRERPLQERTLAYHYSTERAPVYCKETRFTRRDDGSISVSTHQLSKSTTPSRSDLIRYAPPPVSDYVPGRTMAQDFVDLVTKPGWEMAALLRFFEGYRAALLQLLSQEDPPPQAGTGADNRAFPGSFFDLVPQNLVFDVKRGWVAIDREWHLASTVDFNHLVFRALVTLSRSVTFLERPTHDVPRTWGELTQRVFAHLGLSANPDHIARLAAFEEQLKSTILGRASSTAFLEIAIAYRRDSSHDDNVIRQRDAEKKAKDAEIASMGQTLELKSKELAEALTRSNSLAVFMKHYCARKLRPIPLPTVLSDRGLRREMVRTGLFDPGFYNKSYPDVAHAGVDPLDHYLSTGWREGRDPSDRFSALGYLKLHSDVAARGLEPLTHFLRRGRKEGRSFVSRQGIVEVLPESRTILGNVGSVWRVLKDRPDLPRKFLAEARRGGLKHALRLTKRKLSREAALLGGTSDTSPRDSIVHGKLKVVPFYTNPHLQKAPTLLNRSVGIHLHLFYSDMASVCIGYLRNVPVPFDLFISAPGEEDLQAVEAIFRSGLPQCRRVVVERVVNRGRDLAPFITQFGPRLLQYDYIAHFHTKRSPHRSALAGWFDALMDTLCGSELTVTQILHLLDGDGAVVFPVGNTRVYDDESGWGENFEIARELLSRHTDISIGEYPYVEYPQGSMFWAKSACLTQLLSLPLSYEDFPGEPIGADATLAHALERLILIFASQHPGRNYQLGSTALSLGPQDYFEEQEDYRENIRHDSIKVLAYYLPQFHPTPENDEWHGQGFTEWYKVRGANPLFEGHYQQHIPHPDIGYYHLDSGEVLRKQAEMMARAGVHGLIFYHYWFSGRLILEKPAQMLLADTSIELPFCFCWANENWTRRWDGNEREVLLEQIYSPDDARRFIRYLIPFFQDRRYITIDGRPVLCVYRPASIPDCDGYLAVWREECAAVGLPPPYVVATLTRGATSPRDFGMDAAVERPLHDWTGGAVAELRSTVKHFWPVNGSVLDYSAVADHYIEKEVSADFPLFRSLIPVWDNTARYGSEAYVVHNFSPRKMQTWLEYTIRFSEQHLPSDRRFIVVNAWNEWAEGAHLEPDVRFGYAYLNSVGRALSGLPFDALDFSKPDIVASIRLSLHPAVEVALGRCKVTRDAFVRCVKAATGLQRYRLLVDSREMRTELQDSGCECGPSIEGESCYELYFERPVLFPANTIDALIEMARRHKGFTIAAQPVNSPAFEFGDTTRNFSIPYALRGGIELRPSGAPRGRKVSGEAVCFHLGTKGRLRTTAAPAPVTTVIRFHRHGDRKLLRRALYSLLAQSDCVVRPWLALQDFSDEECEALRDELAVLPFDSSVSPVIRRFTSTPECSDQRSAMLTESLKEIRSGLVTFLDYDDVVFPDAYGELAARLRQTGKNATFGRVYSTIVDNRTNLIVARNRVYDWGHTWEDFFKLNIAPIHSFMVNLDLVEVQQIKYFPDMKFLEDYYLTLQIFSPTGTDWGSLRRDFFVGDYITRRGGENQTLAIHCPIEREKTVASEEFQRSERRIAELKARIRSESKQWGRAGFRRPA